MKLSKDQYYHETGGLINIVTVTGGTDRVKKITYYENGILKRSFAVSSELFKNKQKAFAYFGHRSTHFI